jgi:hypothetical protein
VVYNILRILVILTGIYSLVHIVIGLDDTKGMYNLTMILSYVFKISIIAFILMYLYKKRQARQ